MLPATVLPVTVLPSTVMPSTCTAANNLGGNSDSPGDPDVFFVVDISVEPRDGDSAHSGRSILRGPLNDT